MESSSLGLTRSLNHRRFPPLQVLPSAAELEKALYNGATSFKDYNNPDTLDARLQALIQRLNTNARQHRAKVMFAPFLRGTFLRSIHLLGKLSQGLTLLVFFRGPVRPFRVPQEADCSASFFWGFLQGKALQPASRDEVAWNKKKPNSMRVWPKHTAATISRYQEVRASREGAPAQMPRFFPRSPSPLPSISISGCLHGITWNRRVTER